MFGIIPDVDAFHIKHYRRNIKRPFDFLIMSRKGSDDQYMINARDGLTCAATGEV